MYRMPFELDIEAYNPAITHLQTLVMEELNISSALCCFEDLSSLLG